MSETRMETVKNRLEYLRGEIQAERISTGELLELHELAPFIDAGDVELLEAAGVPEFEPDDPDTCEHMNFDEYTNRCEDCGQEGPENENV